MAPWEIHISRCRGKRTTAHLRVAHMQQLFQGTSVSVHEEICSMMWAKREKWIHVVLQAWIVISGTHKQNWVLAWLAKQKHQNARRTKNGLMLLRGETRQMVTLVAYQNKPLMWFIQQLVLISHFRLDQKHSTSAGTEEGGMEGLGLIYTTGPTMWRSVVWFTVFALVSDCQLQSKVHHVESKQKQNEEVCSKCRPWQQPLHLYRRSSHWK